MKKHYSKQLLILLILSASIAHADTYEWTSNDGDNWVDGGNWGGASGYPGDDGDNDNDLVNLFYNNNKGSGFYKVDLTSGSNRTFVINTLQANTNDSGDNWSLYENNGNATLKIKEALVIDLKGGGGFELEGDLELGDALLGIASEGGRAIISGQLIGYGDAGTLDASSDISMDLGGSTTSINGGTIAFTAGNNDSFTGTIKPGLTKIETTSVNGFRNATINLSNGGNGFLFPNNAVIKGLTGNYGLQLQQSGSARSLKVGNGNTGSYSYSGSLSGSGGLTKLGSGTWTISGSNTYTGGTTVNNGTLKLGSASAWPGRTLQIDSNGTLDVTGAISVTTLNGSGDIDLNTGSGVTVTTSGSFSGDISGAGDFVSSPSSTLSLSGNISNVNSLQAKSGVTAVSGSVSGSGYIGVSNSGVLALTGTNTLTGNTELSSNGTLIVSSNAKLGNTASNIEFGGGGLQVTQSFSTSRELLFVNNSSSAELIINEDKQLTWAGAISAGNANNVITKSGLGDLVLTTSANAYVGSLVIEEGSVTVPASSLENAAVQIDVDSGLVLTADETSLGMINGSGNFNLTGGKELTIGENGGAGNYSGTILVSNIGDGVLHKEGAGEFKFGGQYLGTLNFNGGELILDGNLTNPSLWILNSAASTTLAGQGYIAGISTLKGNISPDNPAIGSFIGSIKCDSVSLEGEFFCDISGASSDKLIVDNAFDPTDATFVLGGTTPSEDVYVIVEYGSLAGHFDQTLQVPSGYRLDYAYNDGNDTKNIALIKDNTSPRVASITTTQSTPTNLGDIAYTVTFTEPVVNFNALEDLAVTGVSVNGATVTNPTNDNTTYIVTLTGITGDGTLGLSVDASAGIRDFAFNVLISDGNNSNSSVEIDNTAPSVASITTSQSTPTNANSILYTVTFSEGVENFDALNDLTVSGGPAATSASISNPSGDGKTYNVTLSGVSGNGLLHLRVKKNTGVADQAGNTLVNTDDNLNNAITIDNEAPTATISLTGNTSTPTNANTVYFDVKFSEDVTGVDVNDFTHMIGNAVEHGVLTMTKVTNSHYTITVRELGDLDGSFGVSVKASGSNIEDAAGNVFAVPVGKTITLDNTAPMVASITTSQSTPTNTDEITFTVTFTEAVENFDGLADIIVAGVSAAGATITNPQNDDITYIVALTGITGDGTLSLSVNAGSDVEDLVGNAFGSDSNNINTEVEIDNIQPRVESITTGQSSPTNLNSVIYTVTFDEAVDNFGQFADLTITGVTATGATITQSESNERIYTVVVTGISENGVLALSVNAASDITDIAGNAFLDDANNTNTDIEIDNTAPIVQSITTEQSSTTNANSILYTVTFSEEVDNFVVLDLSITGSPVVTAASISNPLGDGKTYNVTLNGVSGNGVLNLAILTNTGVADQAGNALVNSNDNLNDAITIDNEAPTATISLTGNTSTPTNANTVYFDVKFSEDVTGVDVNDFTHIIGNAVEHGVLTMTKVTNSHYTITVRELGDLDGSFAVSVKAFGSNIKDTAENVFAVPVGKTITLDNTAPMVASITTSQSTPTNTDEITFTVTFTEAVENFDGLADIIVAGVSAAGATITNPQNDDITYIVALTGITGDGTLSLSVNAGSDVEDIAGNAFGSDSNNTNTDIEIDNTAPDVAKIEAHTDPAHNSGSIVFSVNFTEPVLGIEVGDFKALGLGETAELTSDASGQNYTMTFTGVESPRGSVELLLLPGSGIADEAGNALPDQPYISPSIQVDTVDPTATISPVTESPTSADSVTFLVEFSEGVESLDSADFSVTAPEGIPTVSVALVPATYFYHVTLSNLSGVGDVTLGFSPSNDITDGFENDLGASAASASITISVFDFAEWASSYGLSGDDALPTANPDGDQWNNLQEAAFNGDPTSSAANGKKRLSSIDIEGNDYLYMTVPVRVGAVFSGQSSLVATVGDITYTVEGTVDLVNFDIPVGAIRETGDTGLPINVTGLPALDVGWQYFSFLLAANPEQYPEKGRFIRIGINSVD